MRELDPQRDAARYAEQLLELHPRLFARIDGGVESVAARMAARTMALDHLREICRLSLGPHPHGALSKFTLTELLRIRYLALAVPDVLSDE